ncbi:FAD-binding protein [Solimonas sp. K1W22B-7]|uniref:cholesterol oxidase substrate-binding domain-containing protein n=1 Tax=Solimonas sp. K1W22B-7 TaxID=2303331 RepID=UPI000E33561B|nr:FAD-binding protein [Solimonas sp. K1W22B-7]
MGSAAALAAWAPLFRLTPADAASGTPPPAFPAGIDLYRQGFENWAGDIRVDALWTCAPARAQDVVVLANWAKAQGWRLRPRGSMHNWSPLALEPGTDCDARILMVDTTQHLTAMEMVAPLPEAAVRVQAGTMLEDLLGFLELNGCGLAASPAPGDVTVGGMLAIGCHGTGVPAPGETRKPGHTFGTLSNLVVSITAVVWDEGSDSYKLRTLPRSHPHCKALMTHLGRSFVTEVVLRAGANVNLRCQSFMNIPASEMFGAPGSGGRTLASFVEQSGRVEAILFPFTQNPWLKVWTVSPTKPLLSRKVSKPYSYIFADSIPRLVSDLADQVMSGIGAATPVFANAEYLVSSAGLLATLSQDIWGPSKNLMLYVKPTTLRVTANGYAILTSRANIQRVVSEFNTKYQAMMKAWQARGLYPVNGPVEIRVTGLDHPEHVGIPGAESPALSAVRPRADHPEWDVAVWLDLLTFPGTPNANEFFREFELWAFAHFSGNYASMRVEWSKGWGYGSEKAWTDPVVLGQHIPQGFRAAAGPGENWDWALQRLDKFDPHRIFSSPMLDRLMPA